MKLLSLIVAGLMLASVAMAQDHGQRPPPPNKPFIVEHSPVDGGPMIGGPRGPQGPRGPMFRGGPPVRPEQGCKCQCQCQQKGKGKGKGQQKRFHGGRK